MTGLKQDSHGSSLSFFRLQQARHSLKNVGALAAVVCMSIALVAYVSHSQSRLAGYEAEITRLRGAIKKTSVQLRDRVKREIASVLVENRVHEVEKRDAVQDDQQDDDDDDAKDVAEQPNHGTTYVRWGRRDCKAPNSKLIYSGLAAGTHYTHTGGGSNYICLDFHVDYTPGKYVDGGQGSSHLYGLEYRDTNWVNNLFDLSDTEHDTIQFHSVPCSVCMAKEKLSQVMIPGRYTCPDGWTTEYKGYVMAGSHGDKHPSEFICVDERPHVVPGTSGDQKGAFLFMVETQCASLLCEPFVAGRELQCVVCSI